MNNWYAKALIALIFLLWIVPTFWLFYPYNPLDVKGIRVMNPGKQVRAGDFLIYEICYEKHMDVPGILNRKIENTFVYDLRDAVASSPTGKGKDLIKIPIPSYVDPAKDFRLRWTVRYQVNPIRWITISVVSDEFEVVK